MQTELLPDIALSSTELEVVATALSQPVVKKYFMSLAVPLAKDIISGFPDTNESAESYLRRQSAVKGSLEAINTLLQIQATS